MIYAYNILKHCEPHVAIIVNIVQNKLSQNNASVINIVFNSNIYITPDIANNNNAVATIIITPNINFIIFFIIVKASPL